MELGLFIILIVVCPYLIPIFAVIGLIKGVEWIFKQFNNG